MHWRDEKGTGFIAGDDGHEYFALSHNIITDGYATLQIGQRVRVRWRAGLNEHGRRTPDAIWPIE